MPGNHDSMVLEPNVRVLVSQMKRVIDQVERAPSAGRARIGKRAPPCARNAARGRCERAELARGGSRSESSRMAKERIVRARRAASARPRSQENVRERDSAASGMARRSDAFATEVVDVPPIGPREVLVWVMAAGINYNNVWASLGKPVDVVATRRRRDPAEPPFTSAAPTPRASSGPSARTSPRSRSATASCCRARLWDENAAGHSRRAPTRSLPSRTRIWGYELNWGSFAQFTRVAPYQCHRKPPQLSWEAAAAYMLVGATAYRQLLGWPPHIVEARHARADLGRLRRPRLGGDPDHEGDGRHPDRGRVVGRTERSFARRLGAERRHQPRATRRLLTGAGCRM